jgi:hypothetical protein
MSRAWRRELGFVAGLAVGCLLFVAGMCWQGISDRAVVLEARDALEAVAVQQWVFKVRPGR